MTVDADLDAVRAWMRPVAFDLAATAFKARPPRGDLSTRHFAERTFAIETGLMSGGRRAEGEGRRRMRNCQGMSVFDWLERRTELSISKHN